MLISSYVSSSSLSDSTSLRWRCGGYGVFGCLGSTIKICEHRISAHVLLHCSSNPFRSTAVRVSRFKKRSGYNFLVTKQDLGTRMANRDFEVQLSSGDGVASKSCLRGGGYGEGVLACFSSPLFADRDFYSSSEATYCFSKRSADFQR
ncbi:hypothetical protein DY000_02048354 [Brassica cretica]|uniref:Uncharacterized protein n=1 Tax=Brassica cretica TaxID=69181 RepID=A0ABQ7F0V6_BRACR|nr:hypothetical protein DY000_02048354 [Brassica cretica]